MTKRHTLFASLSILAVISAGQGAWAQEAAKDAVPYPAADHAIDQAADAPDQATTTEAISPASAPSCGDDTDAVWLGGDDDRSDVATAPDALQASVTPDSGSAFGFRLSGGAQSVRIEARTNNQGDPSLRLLTASGEWIDENDDSDRSMNARIERELPVGDYCVTVADLSDSMNVTLQVSRADQPPLLESTELTCTANTEAVALSQGPLETALAKGAVTARLDVTKNRYLRFRVETPTPVSLRATGDGKNDPQMAIFDESEQMIASNDDADGNHARLDFMPFLAPGEYCLGVGSVSGTPGVVTVSAQQLDPAEYMRRAYERGEMPPRDGSYPVQDLNFSKKLGDVVLLGGATSWFRFQLAERSVVAIHTLGTPTGADTKLVLFDESGRLIEENDDGDSGRNAEITAKILQAGDYMLGLSDVSAQGQIGAPLRPVVILAERFIRAE